MVSDWLWGGWSGPKLPGLIFLFQSTHANLWQTPGKKKCRCYLYQGEGTCTLLVTYTAYSEIWSLHLTHPWGAVGSHSTAPWDSLQILASSRVLTEDRPYIHFFLMVEETTAPGGNPWEHGENMQTPRREALPQTGIEHRMLCPLTKHILASFVPKNVSTNSTGLITTTI